MALKVCGELICLQLRGAKECVEKSLGRRLGGKRSRWPSGTRDSCRWWTGCNFFHAIKIEKILNCACAHPHSLSWFG
jgi:hypothetical protein